MGYTELEPWIRGLLRTSVGNKYSDRFGSARTCLACCSLALLLGASTGCSSPRSTPHASRPKVATAHPWLITNLDPTVETPALLWNGLIGVRIKADGMGEGNTFFDITRYQSDGEEKIIPLPNPLAGQWSVDNETLKPGADYRAELQLDTDTLFISWSQEVKGKKVEVLTVVRLDPKRRIIRQVWRITAPDGVPVWFHQRGLTPTAKSPKKDGIHALYPVEVGGLDGEFRFFATEWDPGQLTVGNDRLEWKSSVLKGQVYAERAISLAPKGQPIFDPDPWLMRALDSGLTQWAKIEVPKSDSKPVQEGESPDVAANRWALATSMGEPSADIEIDGPVEDQQFIRSALFYLRGAVHPQGKMSVSPMGLSSDIYNGHVFWDADIWVFPALALIDPERAAAIPKYRLSKARQAGINFHEWWSRDERPTAGGKMGFVDIGGAPPMGYKFPWESSVSGKETVPGPSKFQDHITGSVGFAMDQAKALDLVGDKETALFDIQVDGFYRLRSIYEKKQFEIRGTMSPDENHIGDNDLYTNLVAQWFMNLGSWDDKVVKQRLAKNRFFWAPYKLPKDDKTFLTYDNDALRSYKQAAAVLSIYPLQYPPAEKQAREMMERFAGKVSKNGPAMSDSIHALIWARLGEKDKAYKAWHDSWKPFVKPPFLLFSEKRNSSRTYFTTGAAGSLQAVLYGFAGLRIDDSVAQGAKWSMPLKGGKFLSIKPNLPNEWKKMTLRNLSVLGKKLTIEIEGDVVKVTRG